MDLRVGIFGSGSAAVRYYDILKQINIDAYFVRESNETLIRNSKIYPVIEKSKISELTSIIIAADTQKRYHNLHCCIDKEVRHLLIEKPIFTRMKEAKLIDKLSRTGCDLYTGDQFYYDDLIDKAVSLGMPKSINIEFVEFIENVTKGRAQSYALSKIFGGPKWTFSHSSMVLYLYLLRLNIIKLGSMPELNIFTDNAVEFFGKIKFQCFDVDIRNKFSNDDSKNEFKLTISLYNGDIVCCDFVNRYIELNGSIHYKSNYSRYDLIKIQTENFVKKIKNNQFKISYENSKLLGGLLR